MRATILLPSALLATLMLGAGSLQAQPLERVSPTTANQPLLLSQLGNPLQRAKNLARQAAEKYNGGLGKYRAERTMHGPTSEAPYVDNGDGSWTFTFYGGPPGWEQGGSPTIESVVTVIENGWDVSIDYNGSVRDRRWGSSQISTVRLVDPRRDTLILADVLDKPRTESASATYNIYAQVNRRWVPVYSSLRRLKLSNAPGRVKLGPEKVRLRSLKFPDGVDRSDLDLKVVVRIIYDAQNVTGRELEFEDTYRYSDLFSGL